MEKVLIVFIVILLQGCHSENITNNSEIIKITDKIPVQKIIYDIVVDSTNSIFDTIAERRIKTNNDFIKICEEKISFENKKIISNIKSYYSNSGNMVYEKAELLNKRVISIFEAIEKDKMIRSSKTVTHFPNEISDTVVLNYNYEYENNILKKLYISSNQSNTRKPKKVVTYNDLGKPIIEFLEFENDTISKKIFSYKNNKIKESVFYDYKKELKVVSTFDEKENIVLDQFFIKYKKGFVETKKTMYKKDRQGNLIISPQLAQASRLCRGNVSKVLF